MPNQEVTIRLPEFHPGQLAALRQKSKRLVLRCGRRWGKTELLGSLAILTAIQGYEVGYFAPDNKRTSEFFHWVVGRLKPLVQTSNQMTGMIRTDVPKGQIECWTLNDINAARGRRYKLVLIDEAAFTKLDNMQATWERSIEPTLFDYGGDCIVASNTNGIDQEQWFWKICNEPVHGFTEYHAPTSQNPHLPMREPGESDADHLIRRQEAIAKLKREKPPLVFQQEHEAEFISWSGVAFFQIDLMFVDGKPVPPPPRCDSVFAVIDTAIKDGQANDGTAVTYWAYNKIGDNFPLILLDWDIVQIEGAVLEYWLPSVFANLETLSRVHRARYGSQGAHIEDKGSGIILLQQATSKGLQVNPIDNKLTSLGKDPRAMNASIAYSQGKVKISQAAFDKNVVYKDVSRNHFLTQVTGFRMADK